MAQDANAPSALALQAADSQAQAKLDGFAPAQLPLLLCALAALGQEPGAALVNAVGEALTRQELQVTTLHTLLQLLYRASMLHVILCAQDWWLRLAPDACPWSGTHRHAVPHHEREFSTQHVKKTHATQC